MKKRRLYHPLMLLAACQSGADLQSLHSTAIAFDTTSGSEGIGWGKGRGSDRDADDD